MRLPYINDPYRRYSRTTEGVLPSSVIVFPGVAASLASLADLASYPKIISSPSFSTEPLLIPTWSRETLSIAHHPRLQSLLRPQPLILMALASMELA